MHTITSICLSLNLSLLSGLPAFDLCPIIVAIIAHFLSARTNPSPVSLANVFGSHFDHSLWWILCYPPIAGHFHSQSYFRECRSQRGAAFLHLIRLMKIQGTLGPWPRSASESEHTVWRRRTLSWPMDLCRRLSISGRVGSVSSGAQSVPYEVLAPAYSKT